MVYFQRLSTGTFRITEHMKLSHLKPFDKTICIFKIQFCLPPGSHNHIHTDKSIGHHFFYLANLRSEQCRIITTAHQLQHIVTATLQRNMEMRHKSTRTRNIFNNLIRQQIGLDGRDTITFYTLHFIQFLHQIKKCFACRLSEIPDIHSGNNYFLSAFPGCPASLRHYVLNPSVTAASTGKRNRTIRAKIVTTILHLQEITGTVTPRTRRRKTANIFGSRRNGFSLLMLLQISKVIHQLPFLLRTENKVYPFNIRYLFRLQLSITSGDNNKGTRMLFSQPMDGLPALFIGNLSNRTSIYNTNIGFLSFTRSTDTGFFQNSANC